MLLDVTARRDAEEVTGHLAAIVASSDDAIISKNLDGIIRSWNDSAMHMFGYTAEEAIGKHITLIIPKERWAEETEILSRLRRGERIDHFETLRVRKDGSTIDLSITVSPVKDSSGRVIGASKVARDISARKTAEEALRNSQLQLAAEASALRDSEERFRKLTETLDAKVRSRTRELEQRNVAIIQQSEELRQLSWRLFHAQDEERRHIARELHDSAGQTLTILGIRLAQVMQGVGKKDAELGPKLEEIQETVLQLHQEIRTTSYLLHPPLLDESGLYSAISWYVEGLRERSGLAVRVDVPEDFGRLTRDLELVIFRVVQECLTNVLRHSDSKTASIRMAQDSNQVTLEIRDQGKGMSPERLAEIQSGQSGVGIRGMRERLRQFDATMNIESDGSGTRVFVAIPLPKSVPPSAREETVPRQAGAIVS